MTEGRPAPGAPVFLWPVGEAQRRSLGGRLQATTDTEGAFQFDSLPPGQYRALASFDVASFDAGNIDEDLAELSGAPVIQCKSGQSAEIELRLWTAPF